MKKVLLIMFLTGVFFACDVDKTEQGESPDLDVDVEADSGELPEYDVDWANVKVDTRTKTVTVPKVVIVQEEEQVEVPYVDVSMPDDGMGNKVERTVMVEAEVQGKMHNLSIKKVYASDDNLIVIAELQEMDQDLKENAVRVSDQLVLNAPEDLDVKRYIVGTKPTGEYNNQYQYVSTMSEVTDMLDNAKLIYE